MSYKETACHTPDVAARVDVKAPTNDKNVTQHGILCHKTLYLIHDVRQNVST